MVRLCAAVNGGQHLLVWYEFWMARGRSLFFWRRQNQELAIKHFSHKVLPTSIAAARGNLHHTQKLRTPPLPHQRMNTVYDGVYHTPLGRFSKVDCSTRGYQHRMTGLRKALGDNSKRQLFWHRHYSNCGDIKHRKSAHGGGDTHRRT